MTTDMNPTVDNLSPCERRWFMKNQDGEKIFCKPPKKPKNILIIELIKDPKWFKIREITYAICIACKGIEPSHKIEHKKEKIGCKKWALLTVESNGTIIYKKKDSEPPPIPSGYRQSIDAWTFVPNLPSCDYRKQETEYSSCGACKIKYFCTREGQCTRIVTACIDCKKRVNN